MILKVLNENPNGIRPLGRHRTQWEDQVQKDLRKLRAGTEAAEGRKE